MVPDEPRDRTRLYWVRTPEDDLEDYAVSARSPEEAVELHEKEIGRRDDLPRPEAEYICDVPEVFADERGHASDALIRACGGVREDGPDDEMKLWRLGGKRYGRRELREHDLLDAIVPPKRPPKDRQH